MSEFNRSTASSSDLRYDAEIGLLAEFWSRLRIEDELGATTWGVLEPLEREVTEALRSDPPDIRRADDATAKAMFLISGIEF